MKPRTVVSILILVFICSMIINGCATTTKTKYPKSSDSTLLVGSIKLYVMGFQGKFREVNGAYTKNIVVYFANTSTKKIIKVGSRGEFGLFYISDLEPGQYVIAGFSKTINTGRVKVKLGYNIHDYPYFRITEGSVNNLGDIYWYTNFLSKSFGSRYATIETHDQYSLENDYPRVENWHKSNNQNSAWIEKNWIDVEFFTNK